MSNRKIIAAGIITALLLTSGFGIYSYKKNRKTKTTAATSNAATTTPATTATVAAANNGGTTVTGPAITNTSCRPWLQSEIDLYYSGVAKLPPSFFDNRCDDIAAHQPSNHETVPSVLPTGPDGTQTPGTIPDQPIPIPPKSPVIFSRPWG